MLVKICGITNLDDAYCATDLGADALGFIFVPSSPRHVQVVQAEKIVHAVKTRYGTKAPLCVGVFVNATRTTINEVVQRVPLDCLQFHGDETVNDMKGYSQAIWKVFRVSEYFDPNVVKQYPVDTCVFDTYDPLTYGGTGKVFNWEKAIEAKKYCRVILSGGLNPGNILQAFEIVHPYGVDVNSGVESYPGKKDHQKMKLLFHILGRGTIL